jgi:hypothetical protein
MKSCKCKDYQDNIKILDTAIILHYSHYGSGLIKSFVYCPFCGNKLEETKK